MNVLLDSHVLLWWMLEDPQLSTPARTIIANPTNLVFVSAATLWELHIKAALGKVILPASFAEVLATESFEAMPVTWAHAHAVRQLPLHHKDPFDRMLIAQCRTDGLVLLTRDDIISRYDVSHMLV